MRKSYNIFLFILVLFCFSCSNIVEPNNDIKQENNDAKFEISTSSSSTFFVDDKITLFVKSEEDLSKKNTSWTYDSNYLFEVSKDEFSITFRALKSGACVVTVEEEETKNKASIEIVINEKTLPPPLSFNPYDKQSVGFDNNPLYSTDHLLNIVKNYNSFGGSLRDKPKPNTGFNLSEENLIFSPILNTTKSLSLIDTTTKEVISDNDIKWFVVQSYPTDMIYSLNDNSSLPDSPLILSEGSGKGNININVQKTSYYEQSEYITTGDIIAVIDNKYIHRKPFYVLNKKEEEKRDIKNDVNTVIYNLISPMWNFTDIEKALFIQETVCKHLTYDMAYVRRATDENIFLKQRAVCEGYAVMYTRLGHELGMLVRTDIDVKEANHAWNRIWVEDGFYYVDTTWDDVADNPDEYILYYFFMPVNTFEQTHPRTFSAQIDGNFGEKYISLGEKEELYKTMKANGMPESNPSNVSRKPLLSKIDFMGTNYGEGYITTSEEYLEYTTGNDGVWHKIIPYEKNKVTNITLRNQSFYDPLDRTPHYILVRRVEPNMESSEYVKINIFDKYTPPTWIEVLDDNVIYNLNTNMEYSSDNVHFKDVTDDKMKLPSGTYYFRLKGSKNSFPSESLEIVIN